MPCKPTVVAKLAPKTASALVRLRQEHLEAGLGDISIRTFETFDETYAQLNSCQKGSRKHDDEAVAYNLADAVREWKHTVNFPFPISHRPGI